MVSHSSSVGWIGAWHLVTSAFTLCGRRGTYGTGLALVADLVAAGPGLAPGRFVWQAWHLVTSAFVLCGRRGTYGTGLALVADLVAAGPALAPRRFVWQAWHLVTSAFVLCGRRGIYGTGLALVPHLVAAGPGLAPRVALTALGWLWWRIWSRLGLDWRRVVLCVAFTALGWLWWRIWSRLGLDWRRVTSAFTLCGRRGIYGTGLALVAHLVAAGPGLAPGRFVRQAWHLVTSAFVLCGRRGTWRHLLSLCVAGVALTALGAFCVAGVALCRFARKDCRHLARTKEVQEWSMCQTCTEAWLQPKAFFEDAEALRSRIGVAEEDCQMSSVEAVPLCSICFSEPGESLMPCQAPELFCRDCWRQYLEQAVQEGRGCLDLRCPAVACKELVRPSLFASLLSEPLLERYQRFLSESLVDDSRGKLRWCPGRNCSAAAGEPGKGLQEVMCPCGTSWCFRCGNDVHLPVACDTVRRWEEKNRDEGCDVVWIKANTKLCPKCQNPIEKNGGCMHMTCRKPGGCGHEFCWICMKSWRDHRQCNAVEEDASGKAATKHELLRYAEQFASKGLRQASEAVAELFTKSLGVTVREAKRDARKKRGFWGSRNPRRKKKRFRSVPNRYY
eukprot:s336_g32.t1